jgi:hypothetical protein
MAMRRIRRSLGIQLSDSTLAKFREARLRKALARRHRRCKECEWPTAVCLTCARTYCPKCDEVCPKCPVHAQESVARLSQAKLRRVGAVNSTQKPTPKPPQLPESVPLHEVPAHWKDFARQISSQGYLLKSLVVNPDNKKQRIVEVFIPAGTPLVKPDLSGGEWHGHHLSTFAILPVKRGSLMQATLGDDVQ